MLLLLLLFFSIWCLISDGECLEHFMTIMDKNTLTITKGILLFIYNKIKLFMLTQYICTIQ